MVIRRTSSCRLYIQQHTTQRKAPWPQTQRERVHLLHDISVTAPVFHFDTSWLNAAALRNTARREKGATKKRERTNPTTQTTNKSPVSNHTCITTKKNKACENGTCNPTKLELSFLFSNNTPQRKAPWPQWGRESTLTCFHSYHRPRIPVGHVLIERKCHRKHCKKEKGATKKRKNQTHQTCVTRRTSSCRVNIQHHTTTEGAVATQWWDRERERVHLLSSIDVTAAVFQLDTSWLNFLAP